MASTDERDGDLETKTFKPYLSIFREAVWTSVVLEKGDEVDREEGDCGVDHRKRSLMFIDFPSCRPFGLAKPFLVDPLTNMLNMFLGGCTCPWNPPTQGDT